MKKNLLAIVLSLCMIMSTVVMAGCEQEEAVPLTGEVINVFNWGEYMSNGDDGTLDVNAEFTRLTGIQVNYTTYQSNEEMYQKIVSGAGDYDIVFPSDYMVEKMIEEDLLEKIDFSNVPNFELISDNCKNLAFDPNNEYSVPYLWSVVGIFYNKTMVDPEDYEQQSLDLLWNEKYAGDILMYNNPRDAFSVALIKLGYSINTTNPDEWQEAYELLEEQKPLVQAYVMDQTFDKMINGEAAVAPYYSGDVGIIIEENPDVGFYIPKEGSELFYDCVSIVKGTEHKEACEAYINFLCSTDAALANTEFVCYSTPQKEAYELLDDEVKLDPNRYPTDDVIANCEVLCDLTPELYTLQNDLWIKLKTE